MAQYITKKQVAYMTGLSLSTVILYLDSWRFSEFRRGSSIIYTRAFLNTLKDFLILKNNKRALNRLNKFTIPIE